MPKILTYKAGSLIYAGGDEADKILLLQNGKASLVYDDLETGEDVRDLLQPGEFFGVKSALGRYPREENAISLSDVSIMAFTVAEFESFALSNTRIVLKMLKVFSTQLRRVHMQVSRLTASDDIKPDEGLFAIGDRYMKARRFAQAKYVFSRYLAYYPTGKDADQARKNLQNVEATLGLSANAASKSPARNNAEGMGG